MFYPQNWTTTIFQRPFRAKLRYSLLVPEQPIPVSIHLNQSTAVEDITLFKDLNLYDNAVTVIVTVINNLGNINKSDFEFPSHICRGGGVSTICWQFTLLLENSFQNYTESRKRIASTIQQSVHV